MKNPCQTSTELPIEGDIESLRLQVGCNQVHYLRAGSGPPVVMVHDGASDCGDWIETIAALHHTYSLYAPDLIGYGLSDRYKSGYYLSDFVEFTLNFTEALGLDSQVLVGHSLGGRVCLEIALRYPERVRSLVLIDTAGFGKLTFLGKILGAAAWGVRKVMRLPQPYPEFLMEEDEDRDWMCLEDLPSLEVPTLIVWNRYDPYYPLDSALRAKDLIPQARLAVFPGYGHAPHVQNRSSFNSLLMNFLDHR